MILQIYSYKAIDLSRMEIPIGALIVALVSSPDGFYVYRLRHVPTRNYCFMYYMYQMTASDIEYL